MREKSWKCIKKQWDKVCYQPSPSLGGCDHLWWSNVVLIPALTVAEVTLTCPHDHMREQRTLHCFYDRPQHSSPSPHQAAVNHALKCHAEQQKFASSYLPSWHWEVSNIPILNGFLFLFETVVISAPYQRVSFDGMDPFWDENEEEESIFHAAWPVIQLRVLV